MPEIAITTEDMMIAAGTDVELVNVISDRCGLDQWKFVLEAGCGSGKIGINMSSRYGCNVTLVDSDQGAATRATLLAGCINALRMGRVHVSVIRHDLMTLGFREGSFDLVFNEGTIEHFRDPVEPVRRMAFYSREYVACIVPNALNLKQRLLAKRQTSEYQEKDQTHWAAYERPMTEEELRGVFESAGLKEVFSRLVWKEGFRDSPSDYRMVVAVGRKP